MKATEILEWIVKESINGEFLNFVDVPEEGNEQWEQNEGWWDTWCGSCPPSPIPSGVYLYYYSGSHDEIRDRHNYVRTPDAVVHLEDDEELIYLYKVED